MLRVVGASDIGKLAALSDAVQLVPADMIEPMLMPFLAGEADEEWLLWDGEQDAHGVAYAAPERLTAGTWNLLMIAVRPHAQRRGIGATLVRAVEARLVARGARLLLVETSGLPAFEGARAFYRSLDFQQEAIIRDFYCPGEDKMIFRKLLPA